VKKRKNEEHRYSELFRVLWKQVASELARTSLAGRVCEVNRHLHYACVGLVFAYSTINWPVVNFCLK